MAADETVNLFLQEYMDVHVRQAYLIEYLHQACIRKPFVVQELLCGNHPTLQTLLRPNIMKSEAVAAFHILMTHEPVDENKMKDLHTRLCNLLVSYTLVEAAKTKQNMFFRVGKDGKWRGFGYTLWKGHRKAVEHKAHLMTIPLEVRSLAPFVFANDQGAPFLRDSFAYNAFMHVTDLTTGGTWAELSGTVYKHFDSPPDI